MLPMDEAVEAMADDAFRALADRPRYVRDGADRLRRFFASFRSITMPWSMGLIWWYRGGTPAKRPALSGRCFRKSKTRYRMAG